MASGAENFRKQIKELGIPQELLDQQKSWAQHLTDRLNESAEEESSLTYIDLLDELATLGLCLAQDTKRIASLTYMGSLTGSLE